MTKTLQKNTYQKLVSDISSLYESARKTLVTTYWEIGKRIVQVEQSNNVRAGYAEFLLGRLSKDLCKKYGEGFSRTNLSNMRHFYLTHPIIQTSGQLDWSHYVALLSVEDTAERTRFEKQAYKEDLSAREVREMVRSESAHYEKEGLGPRTGRQSSGAVRESALQCTRGALNTYGVVEAKTANTFEGFVTLDLGFNVWREIPTATAKKFATPAQYFYTARVEKVIDGDTLWAVIECGFRTKVREKLRLRGVDASEVTTATGQQAKTFVQRRLPVSSLIVIRTSTSDKYDRYLADVFYNPKRMLEVSPVKIAKDGTYLNQELLDAGLARFFVE